MKRTRCLPLLLCALVVLALGARPAHAQSAASLRAQLEAAVHGYSGVAGVSVRNLATGESISINGDEPFPSASLIKVSVLVGLMDQIKAGQLAMSDPISLLEIDKVPGSGVLQYLHSGLHPTVGDAAWLMITLSDNTATNLLLEKLSIPDVWAKMDSLGLPHTRVYRRSFHANAESPLPDSAAVYGLGETTPNEMLQLFSLLYQGRAVSPALDSLALTLLKANQNTVKIVRWIPQNVVVAHKTGEIDRARNDCGIIYSPAASIALCVMTKENPSTSYAVDNPAALFIAGVGRMVFHHYNPSVALPPLPWGTGGGR